jgi:FkbM family methyltransferase
MPSSTSSSWKMALGRAQRKVAKIRPMVDLALKVRNQCDGLIRNALSDGVKHENNGEALLATVVAPYSRFFIDVGANAGHWAAMFLHGAGPEIAGLCFEPSPSMLPTLRAALLRWPNVEVVEAAIGDQPAQLTLHAHRGSSEGSTLTESRDPNPDLDVVVPVTTLDVECESRGWSEVDMLKIDAEGFDFKVLRGAAGLIKARRIQVIQFEYGDRWAYAGDTLAAAIRFLRDSGYDIYLLKSTGLHDPEYERFGEHFSYSNYIAFASFSKVRFPGLRNLRVVKK